MALVVLSYLNFIETILLDCIVTAVISACIFLKNLSKSVNFCAAILILKMEENVQHIWYVILYYFKEDKNATETHTQKRFRQYIEKLL